LKWSFLLEVLAQAQHPFLLAVSRTQFERLLELTRHAGSYRAVSIRCSATSLGGICKDTRVLETFADRYLAPFSPLVTRSKASNPRELADTLNLAALEALLPSRESSCLLALAELLDEHPARDCCAPFAEVILRGCTAEKLRCLVELEAAAAEKCEETTLIFVSEREYASHILGEKLPPAVRLLVYWGPAPPPHLLHPVNFVGPAELARGFRGIAHATVSIGEGYVMLLAEE